MLPVYSLARPLLFSLDPEAAHDLTLNQLRRAHRLGLLRCFGPVPLAPATLMGLRLRNPVGLAAGLDKNASCIDPFGALGFGFIEAGTVTPRPQPGNAKPRMFRLPEADALINRFGFNNVGLAAFIDNVKRSRYRAEGGILGLNLGKNADTPLERAADDYVAGLRAAHAHADYITINISSPNTANLRSLQQGDELTTLLTRLAEVRAELADAEGRRVPLAVKIAPDLDDAQIDQLGEMLPRHGIDGVIATNTTLDRATVGHLRHGQEAGGLSGRPVHEKALRVIRRLRSITGPDFAIVGVGGTFSGADARAKMDAGANAVQLYTGLIYRGPGLVRECVEALRPALPQLAAR